MGALAEICCSFKKAAAARGFRPYRSAPPEWSYAGENSIGLTRLYSVDHGAALVAGQVRQFTAMDRHHNPAATRIAVVGMGYKLRLQA